MPLKTPHLLPTPRFLCLKHYTISPRPSLRSPAPTPRRTRRLSTKPTHPLLQRTFSIPLHPKLSTADPPSPWRTLKTSPSSQFPEPQTQSPAPISIDEYHTLSDAYIETLLSKLEELQEERDDVDVEYSAGVLTFKLDVGREGRTYVLNKQPPNKQIWLSSPVSGPKRYDWVVKEAAADGDSGERGSWVYLRDGSTLDSVWEGEVGVIVGEPDS